MSNAILTEERTTEERDLFVDRLLQSIIGAFDVFAIYLGHRLQFYRILAGVDSLTSPRLADRAECHERYVREWLEQQAASGILEVENEKGDALDRRYRLPASRAEVLAEQDSINFLAPFAQLLAGAVRPLDLLLSAYRTGDGVPLEAYGNDFLEGQAFSNRAAFLQLLGSEWLPAVPDVHARLLADPPARVADIGCGAGWSSIGIARQYPGVRVDGFDLDRTSVEAARRNAADEGLDGRVDFQVRDAGDPELAGRYDLALALECVHDMSDPVSVLRAMRRLTEQGGAVIVMDERVGERFTSQADDVERMMYGWSILHCLPAGMAQKPSVATGTVMRPETLRRYAAAAGYRDVEVLPIENYFWRFYRLHAD